MYNTNYRLSKYSDYKRYIYISIYIHLFTRSHSRNMSDLPKFVFEQIVDRIIQEKGPLETNTKQEIQNAVNLYRQLNDAILLRRCHHTFDGIVKNIDQETANTVDTLKKCIDDICTDVLGRI